jgi:hypothetical protein
MATTNPSQERTDRIAGAGSLRRAFVPPGELDPIAIPPKGRERRIELWQRGRKLFRVELSDSPLPAGSFLAVVRSANDLNPDRGGRRYAARCCRFLGCWQGAGLG